MKNVVTGGARSHPSDGGSYQSTLADISRKEKNKVINWSLSMKPEMINMERISQWEITAIDEKSLKNGKKRGKEKKICGIIIIDETWKFSFRNQTKGLRCRTYSWITSCFLPVFQTQSLRSSGNAIWMRDYSEMTQDKICQNWRPSWSSLHSNL